MLHRRLAPLLAAAAIVATCAQASAGYVEVTPPRGDGKTVSFKVKAKLRPENTLVFLGGLFMNRDAYRISGHRIVFASPPLAEQPIIVFSK